MRRLVAAIALSGILTTSCSTLPASLKDCVPILGDPRIHSESSREDSDLQYEDTSCSNDVAFHISEQNFADIVTVLEKHDQALRALNVRRTSVWSVVIPLALGVCTGFAVRSAF